MTTEQDRPKAGAEDAPTSAAEDEIDIEVVDDEADAKAVKPEKAAAGEGDEPAGDGDEDDGEADERVKRERSRRRKAERDRDSAARRSAEKDEKIAELEGRLTKVETRQVRADFGTAEARLAAFDRDVADAKKARRQAKADGDDEAEETATELWIRTQAKRDNLAGLIDQAKRRGGTTRGDEGEAEPRGRQRQQAEPAITSQAKAWMRRNAAWFDPELGDEQSQMAAKASEVLTAQGFEHDDPKHFEALDKRMKAIYPGLYRNKDAGRPTAAAGGSRGGAEQRGNGRQTVQLPRGLVRNFEAAGFDVNDPKVKVQMVKSYQEQQAKAAGGRAR